MVHQRPHRIGVIGSGHCSEETAHLAEDVGRGIARRGAILICGGLGGVMEAAARGAHQAGGLTVGILPGTNGHDANPYIRVPIITGIGEARNVLVVTSSEAVIAISGGMGTLAEMAFCLKFRIPLIGIRTWEIDPGIEHVATAAEAVERAFHLITEI